MSKYSERIREIVEKANSNKIMKIRKCIAELSELYENPEAVNEICKNSEENRHGIVDWPYIMYTVHKLLLNEANRLAVKDNCNRNIAERQTMCAVVLNTVRHAHVGTKPLLKCSDVIPLVFQVLEAKLYEHYQETYLAILVTYLLPNRCYHIDILSEQWRELLRLCAKLYKNGSPSVNKRSILEVFQMSIEYGCLHSNLILEVKKLLPLLETIFLDAKANQDVLLEPTFKLAYTICIHIGTECRIAICQFSEKVLPDIISLNSSIDKYKLLLLLVQIHHPKGISCMEDGAYAHNWSSWITILKSIYFMIMRDCKSDLLARTFIQLATEVLKQVFDNPACISEPELFNKSSYAQPTKRRRFRVESPVDMIIDSSSEDAWPIVQILTVLIEKYPECIKPQEFKAFLAIITNLMTQSCKNESIMNHLYELTAVLMHNEDLFSTSLIHTEEIMLQLCKIWDILLRSLSMNQCEIKGHLLVQCFILNNKITNPNALLRLYLAKIIKWSPVSLHTLMLFCEHVPLPEDAAVFNINTDTYPTDSIKLCLLEWILNIPWNKMAIEVPIDDLCLTLINIISNVWFKEIMNHVIYNVDNTSMRKKEWCNCSEAEMHDNTNLSLLQYIEHNYLLLSCRTNLVTRCRKTDTKSDAKPNKNAVYIKHLLDYIIKNLSNAAEETNTVDDLCVPLIKITIIGRLASMLKQLNTNFDDAVISGMIQTMRAYFKTCSNLIVDIDPTRTKYSYLVNITKALNILYSSSYTVDMTKVIISCSTSDMLKSIFNLMNVKDNETLDYCDISDYYKDYSAFQGRRRRSDRQHIQRNNCSFCKDGIIRTQATKALTLFSYMNTGMSKSEVQIILLKNLLNVDMYDVTSMVDFKMAMIVLESLANYNEGEISEAYGDIPVKFISKLYRKCYKDGKAVRYILNILPCSFKYAIKSNDKDIINIVSEVHNYLRSKNCGSLVHMEFMNCMLQLLQINSSLFWRDEPLTKIVPFTQIISVYLNSPICALRFKALYCIKKIYSMEDVDLKWKKMFFENLEGIVTNMFTIDRKVEEFEKADEKETRIFSALLVFATVICNNGALQSRALLGMLQISIDKQINTSILQRVLNAVVNQTKDKGLVEDNLMYLLSNWLNSQHTLKMFPWNLLNCTSEEEFYKKYINTLVLMNIQTLDIAKAIELCNTSGMAFNKVFEKIFPQVLSCLLCSLCDDRNSNQDKIKSINKLLYKLLKNQDEFISVKKFPELLTDKFEETVISLIQRLHDEDFLECILELRTLFPKSDLIYGDKSVIEKSFKYMEMNFFAQKKSLQYILVDNHTSCLQRILLALATSIYKGPFLEHKLKAFHQYVYFCILIMEELCQSHFDAISMYLIRDISYTLLHLTKLDDNVLSESACKFFHIFVKSILPKRDKEIKAILSFSVRTLIPIVEAGKMQTAKKVLNFLIIDKKELLYDAISSLNSFPNTSAFQEICKIHNALKYKTEERYSLKEEIQHFLDAASDKSIDYSVEDLSHLKFQLSARKRELQDMYDKLETLRGFAEDCALSMLHRLIYRLIKLTGSANNKISMEAAKCLGELGPADLTTMVLYLGKSHVKETSDLFGILSYKIVVELIELLVHSTVEMRKASSNALHIVLSSVWGQRLTNRNYVKELQTMLEEPETALCIDYIRPFIVHKKPHTMHIIIDDTIFNALMNANNSIWTVDSNGTYAQWITNITCNIINCFQGSFFECLIPAAKLSTDFCELILPKMMFLTIHLNKEMTNIVSHCINEFFDYHFNPTSSKNKNNPLQKTTCNHQIVHCMLDVVNYIRIQIADSASLILNYMYIAKAAQYCSAFFTAVLYAELACEMILTDCHDFYNIPKIDYVYERDPVQGSTIQNILRDTYLKIGDPDAIYGCGLSYLVDPSSRIQHYKHAHKWDRVMLAQDIELSSGNSIAVREMANALHQCGLQYLLGHFVSTLSKDSKAVDDNVQYECAWRLSNWNLRKTNQAIHLKCRDDTTSEITEMDYHFYHYEALQNFYEKNQIGVQTAIENARTSIIKALKNISLESSKTVYEKLTQLQMVREIEELNSTNEENYKEILSKWELHSITKSNEFQYIEPILTQRTVMYQMKNASLCDTITEHTIANTYLEIAKVAANQGYLQVATRALAALAKQEKLALDIKDQLQYQESLLSWIKNDVEIGRFLLRNLINKKSLDLSLRAKALRVYGDWMAETKSENPQAVIRKYYEESINISNKNSLQEDSNIIKTRYQTQVALARFADAQFAQISSYMKSPQFESLKECVNYSLSEVNVDPHSKDYDLKRATIIKQRQSSNDIAELENIKKERNNYLILALKYYLMTLQGCEDYNLLIFRLIALWLDNMYHEEVNVLLQNNLDSIPSYKFIPLIPQLAAHMSHNLDEFSGKIYKIMERCALEHPHHTLPVLMALRKLHGDQEYDTEKKATKSKDEPRVLGAKKLLKYLSTTKANPIIQEMDKLSHALVMLAYLNTHRTKLGQTHTIPQGQHILKIKNFENVLVPTITINVRPSAAYDNIVGVAKYVANYQTVGGVNAPKKLTCMGTDGICRYQLVKGKDDLRQDAVMQQVFTVMNTLLKACKETKRRKLNIRTYKVVPLTERSGILEWCNNTIPIATAIIGSDSTSGIHGKYYPKDCNAQYCKDKISAASKASNDEKLRIFLECCTNMHPAFHHFFMEKYPSPETWFERRLAYTRSVATTSMVGYILGLGDRHLNNILIDQKTAEVIHIDFGIAFEQGKVLPIPETVPFRLTRNIEVAMGVAGVEGTMRRCCEETLMVLRDQKQIIITLLQVLLYDPLFTWTITPAKAHNIQGGNTRGYSEINQVTNKTAERALLRIEQKLQGTEEGLASSISGQVERLIQQARDPSNLCRLYCGWQPYL